MAMAKRQGLSKKLRFEVFKRDSFTCQYCGAKAPDVLLHADHIKPYSKGGKNSILNLVTACASCNGGKSNSLLSENQSLDKARNQAELLQQRREQIEMIAEWHNGLANLDTLEVESMGKHWTSLTGWGLNESGLASLLKWKRQFGMVAVLEAMTISNTAYLAGKKITKDMIEDAFRKIGGICFNKVRDKEDPIGATVRKLANFFYRHGGPDGDRHQAEQIIRAALEDGMTQAELRGLVYESSNAYGLEKRIAAKLGWGS